MRIKAQDIREGLHPGEAIATISTLAGLEELIVDRRSGKLVEVGNPVGQHGDYYLVELPSETSGGAWRVWVEKKTVIDSVLEAAE